MTRSPKRSELPSVVGALALGVLGSACGARQTPLAIDTVSELDSSPRRAPGVAVDPTSELPKSAPAAHSEDGVVVLKAPLDPESAREMVRAFFRAVSQGSYSDLEAVLPDEAWLSAGAMAGRQKARQYWQQRLSRLDYASLAGTTVFREGELETYRAADLAALRPPRVLGVVAQGDDVIVRVPIATPRTGKTRLFGDEIVFLLRPAGSKFQIVDMSEDFTLP